MKAVFYFLKQEFASVALVLLSFMPLFFIGSLLDILLTYFYALVENRKTVLPPISQWIHESIAGYRFIPQEIMAGFWMLMVLCLILNAFSAKDQQRFRIRFIYSFLFTWVLAIMTATLITLACAMPFDLMLSRLDENGISCSIIHIILLIEVMLMLIMPVGLLIWAKVSRTKQGAAAESNVNYC